VTSEPTHVDVHEKLLLLLDDALELPSASQVRSHLAQCDICRHEWERLQQFTGALSHLNPASLASRLGTPEHEAHLDEEQKWLLADSSLGPDPNRDPALWKHTLNCRECLGAVAERRKELAAVQHVRMPNVEQAAARAWAAITRPSSIAIALSWLGAKLRIVLLPDSAALRPGFATRGFRSDVRDADDQVRECSVGEGWGLERKLGEFEIRLTITPRSDHKSVDLTVTVQPRAERLLLELRHNGGELQRHHPDIHGGFALTALPLGKYSLRLVDTRSEKEIGAIELRSEPER
jgi:hypothetical protein